MTWHSLVYEYMMGRFDAWRLAECSLENIILLLLGAIFHHTHVCFRVVAFVRLWKDIIFHRQRLILTVMEEHG
jgi:hypothetical protein